MLQVRNEVLQAAPAGHVNFPSSVTGCISTWSAPAARCSRGRVTVASGPFGTTLDIAAAARTFDIFGRKAESLQVVGVVGQPQVALGVVAGRSGTPAPGASATASSG